MLGYKDLVEFSRETFGFNKTSVYNYIGVYETFVLNADDNLNEKAHSYSFQQLVEMKSQVDKIDSFSPQLTVAETKLQKVVNEMDDEFQKAYKIFSTDIYNCVCDIFNNDNEEGLKLTKISSIEKYPYVYSDKAFRFFIKSPLGSFEISLTKIGLIDTSMNYEFYNNLVKYCDKSMIEKIRERYYMNHEPITLDVNLFLNHLAILIPALIKSYSKMVVLIKEEKEFKLKEKQKINELKLKATLKSDDERYEFVRSSVNWTKLYVSKDINIMVFKFCHLDGKYLLLCNYNEDELINFSDCKIIPSNITSSDVWRNFTLYDICKELKEIYF